MVHLKSLLGDLIALTIGIQRRADKICRRLADQAFPAVCTFKAIRLERLTYDNRSDRMLFQSQSPSQIKRERHMRWRTVLVGLIAMLAACSSDAANPVVVVDTTYGPIKIELFEDKAPVTVKNFLAYTDEQFYDGLIFHRVMDGFMIQGGGFEPGMKERKTHEPIKNESDNGLSNLRGTIAMARTNDPDSATAQFFINVADNKKALDKSGFNPGYCVFGRVIDGMDVVDKIKKVRTASKGGHENIPVEDIVIKSVRREK
jgi:cyclophilin family peptidyl-prolyl cis-trans isomerase